MVHPSFLFKIISWLILCILTSSNAWAQVIGREGLTYPIIEEDMRELIQKRAEKFDFDTWMFAQQARLSDSFHKFRPADAISGLPAARQHNAYRVDMSYTLPYDISDIQGNVIYPAGYTFSPLSQLVQHGGGFNKVIVVLNGDNQNEVEWFKSKFKNEPLQETIILLSDGYAIEMSNILKQPVYYLTTLLQERLRVKETPSIILQTANSELLTVKSYAIDSNGKEIRDTKGGKRKSSRGRKK